MPNSNMECYEGCNFEIWQNVVQELLNFKDFLLPKLIASGITDSTLSNVHEDYPIIKGFNINDLKEVYNCSNFIEDEFENINRARSNEAEREALCIFDSIRLLLRKFQARDMCYRNFKTVMTFYIDIRTKEHNNDLTAIMIDFYASPEPEKLNIIKWITKRYKEYQVAMEKLEESLKHFHQSSKEIATLDIKTHNKSFNPNRYLNYHIFDNTQWKRFNNFTEYQDNQTDLWKLTLNAIKDYQVSLLQVSSPPTRANSCCNKELQCNNMQCLPKVLEKQKGKIEALEKLSAELSKQIIIQNKEIKHLKNIGRATKKLDNLKSKNNKLMEQINNQSRTIKDLYESIIKIEGKDLNLLNELGSDEIIKQLDDSITKNEMFRELDHASS